MNAMEIKTELRQMIEQEKDMSVLAAIRTLLQKTSLDPVLREKLTLRALKSGEDIASGNLLSKEEVIKQTQRR